MSTGPKARPKKWQPGDLVLLASGPKIHRQLMEVLEVRRDRARTAYLETGLQSRDLVQKRKPARPEAWHPLQELCDPALFLKTDEFVRTLQERSRRKSKP
jgi:hypothetical protein